jgi:GGDEF domain-containing protein
VLTRIRSIFLLVIVGVIAYAAGRGSWTGPFADCAEFLRLVWAEQRLGRANAGILPLLVSGYLIGHGLYLLIRQVGGSLNRIRVGQIEAIASWDPAVQLATRFGLHLYLEQCAKWSGEDPTTRMQSLSLFKISGLGQLNQRGGTLTTTELLQRVGIELRMASLPDNTTFLRRLKVQHFPDSLLKRNARIPQPRFPARWSGATFALAFRELDAMQAVSITRGVADWIRREIDTSGSDGLSVSAAIVVGVGGVYGRELASAAKFGLSQSDGADVTVVVDGADPRAKSIEQLAGVRIVRKALCQADEDAKATSFVDGPSERLMALLRVWGPGIACWIGAILVLLVVGTKAYLPNIFPWPDSLNEVQVVDSGGSHRVKLLRRNLESRQVGGWRVANGLLIQGDPADGSYGNAQVRLSVTNLTQGGAYISLFDFTAIDQQGNRLEFDPLRVLRMSQGLTGKWLKPRESWTAWLILSRGQSPVTQIVFQPAQDARLELAVVNSQ